MINGDTCFVFIHSSLWKIMAYSLEFSGKPNIERAFVNVNTLTREPSFVQESFNVIVADFFYAITNTIEY